MECWIEQGYYGAVVYWYCHASGLTTCAGYRTVAEAEARASQPPPGYGWEAPYISGPSSHAE